MLADDGAGLEVGLGKEPAGDGETAEAAEATGIGDFDIIAVAVEAKGGALVARNPSGVGDEDAVMAAA